MSRNNGKPGACAGNASKSGLTDAFVPFAGRSKPWIHAGIARARAKVQQYEKALANSTLPVRGQGRLSGNPRLGTMLEQWRRHLTALSQLQSRNQYHIEQHRLLLRKVPHLLSSGGVYVSCGQLVTFVRENHLWYQVTVGSMSGYLFKGDVRLTAPVDIYDVSRKPVSPAAPPQRDELDMAARDTVMR